MVLILSNFLDQKICIEKALKISIVHDLAELITGDNPCFIHEGHIELEKDKFQQELIAMKHIRTCSPR